MLFWLILIIIIWTLVLFHFIPFSKKSVEGKHVIIIGGSSGIGKSAAVLLAKEGAHVTIIARNVQKLQETVDVIKKYCVNPEKQKINMISVDIGNYDALEKNLIQIETDVGPVYMLVNCAGMAICGTLEEFSLSQIKQMIDANLIGNIYTLKILLPKFKQRKEGIIVLTGSQASLLGIYGYSVYSSCKFALRGLAESVYMEAKPYNITVTLAVPPDTDTPGFEIENKTKPIETKLISGTGGLFDPDVVASQIINDALTGKFFSYVGFESFMVTTLCTGMSPFRKFTEVLLEAALLGPLRLVSSFYIVQFSSIIKKCYGEKQDSKIKKKD